MTIGNIGNFYSAQNVHTGSAAGFIAPPDTAFPGDSITVFDPLIWVAPWVPAGATEQGWQVNWNAQTNDINIDEQPTPVDQVMTSAALTFVANLAEDTIQTHGWVFNATKTVQTATVTLFGKTRQVPQSTMIRYAVAVETQDELTMPRRYFAPRMTAAGGSGPTFRRTEMRMQAVTFTSICNISEIIIDSITANHS